MNNLHQVTKELPIHVCIPVYNNALGVKHLLNQLSDQGFASITVLNDASTDNIQEVVASFPAVKIISAKHNLGTVGANNLILQNMPEDGFLLCIDSDMDLQTSDVIERMRAFLAAHPRLGAAVGRVQTASGERVKWNFDYDLNPLRGVAAALTYYPASCLRHVPLIHSVLAYLSTFFVHHYADDTPKKIDWGIESFFFVRCDLFSSGGGFDTRFKRFHEGPDLFLRLRKQGYETWYCPDIAAVDTNQSTGSALFRKYHWWRSAVIYFYKHPSRLVMYKYPRP